jgi:CRP-like cAMP-binding protein
MATYRNRLLAALPRAELDRIEPRLEAVPLERRMVAYDAERPITHVYFVEDGVISIVSLPLDGSAIETATIGIEGMIGLPVFHGVDVVPEQAFVQVPGSAHRMTAEAFREVIGDCPTLQRLLHRCTVAIFTLAAQHSACNRVHTMEQRCARWLLTVHDRMAGDEFDLTQDFLSQMVGVRRATVSEVASELQRAGLISYSRGHMVILDRPGLERVACECYRIVHAAFAPLLEGHEERSPIADVKTSDNGLSLAGEGRSPERTGVAVTGEES